MNLEINNKYPFLYEIVNFNHSYIKNIQYEEDFDSYIIIMNLYLYTCKFMKKHKIELNKENIYKNMQLLFNNQDIRYKLINFFGKQNQVIENNTNINKQLDLIPFFQEQKTSFESIVDDKHNIKKEILDDLFNNGVFETYLDYNKQQIHILGTMKKYDFIKLNIIPVEFLQYKEGSFLQRKCRDD